MRPTRSLIVYLGSTVLPFLVRQSLDQCGGECNEILFKFDTSCGVDPSDGSKFGQAQQACLCEAGSLECVVTYTGTDGGVTVASAWTSLPAQAETSFTFGYGFPNTLVRPGSPVSFEYRLPDQPPRSEAFIYSPVTSVSYAEATATATEAASSTAASSSPPSNRGSDRASASHGDGENRSGSYPARSSGHRGCGHEVQRRGNARLGPSLRSAGAAECGWGGGRGGDGIGLPRVSRV